AEGFAKTDEYMNEHGNLGSDITVTVTMVDGWITQVIINGPDETPSLGAILITIIQPKIIEYNTFELENYVDAIAGASETFEGIKEAGLAAIDQIIAASE
ncbi:MAG: FMN-binding protein, partial [Spirochaetaceae bacterium]|nr:FMN-binding protein [Spirochaetaceae bacterium]